MEISARHTFDATPQAVYEMMTTPEWLDRVAVRVGAVQHASEVDGGTTKLTAGLPSPKATRSFTGDVLTIHLTQNWGEPDAAGRRTGNLEVTVDSLPAVLRGDATLGPDGAGTAVEYTGDFSISIPLLGRKLEQTAYPHVAKVLDVQEQVGREWLAERA